MAVPWSKGWTYTGLSRRQGVSGFTVPVHDSGHTRAAAAHAVGISLTADAAPDQPGQLLGAAGRRGQRGQGGGDG